MDSRSTSWKDSVTLVRATCTQICVSASFFDMTVISPLYSMVNRLGQLALQDGSDPSPKAHFELLRMIDQLRLAVETPTETVLRLIYQVSLGTFSGPVI
jgi:hypothetical protein